MEIVKYIIIGIAIVAFCIIVYAPFILSGRISEQEDKDGR